MARPSPLEIYALLDKSNCQECGRDTCMAFGTDLLERKVVVQDCTHLMQDPKQAKKRNKLIALVTPPQKSVEVGVGDRKCIIGGEEILNRHQLTYYNETAIFMEIADDDPDLEKDVKYLTDLVLERMGDALQINGIALRCVSGDIEQYKLAAKKLTEASNLPVMLACLNPDILLAAASEIKELKPLLYAATKDTWEQVGKFAVENNLPVVAVSNDLDELLSLSATLQKLGVKNLILDAMTVFGPGNVALTYDNIMRLRISAIDKEDVNAGFPIMGVPAAYWSQVKTDDDKKLWEHQYQEIIMAAIMESIDTSLIVLHSGKRKEDIWAVTSNYRLTKIPVEIDIKGANVDAWLLVVDSEGIGIESAVAGGQFSAGSIAEATKEFGVFDKVDHRILIIPGMAARLSGALEDEADAYVVVGPRDSSGIGKYMTELWKPEEFMEIYEDLKE